MSEPRIEDYVLDDGQINTTEYERDVDQYMADSERMPLTDEADEE